MVVCLTRILTISPMAIGRSCAFFRHCRYCVDKDLQSAVGHKNIDEKLTQPWDFLMLALNENNSFHELSEFTSLLSASS